MPDLFFRKAALEPPPSVQADIDAKKKGRRSESWNEETRQFTATVATEAPARVFDMAGMRVIEEVLVADGGEFPASMPLLDSHDRSTTQSQVGSAHSFRREGNAWAGIGELVANDPEADRVGRLIAGGHLRSVSIGYRVAQFTDIPAGQSKTINGKRYTAGDSMLRVTTAWQVHELSVTPIGADGGALIRSAPTASQSGATPMPHIFRAASKPKTPSVGALTAAVLQSVGLDPVRHRVEQSGLTYRQLGYSPVLERDAEHARDYVGLPFGELLRLAAIHDGLRSERHAAASEIFAGLYGLTQRYSFATLAVGELLTNSIAAIILEGFESEEDSTEGWTRSSESLQVNRTVEMLRPDPADNLDSRASGQTASQSSYSSVEEGVYVGNYASSVDIDEMDLLDGQLAELMQTTIRQLGAAAARLRPDLVYSVLAANANMRDGTPLFDAAHGNLLATSALDATTLEAAAAAMRVQQANGVNLNLRPAYLITPTALERTAGKLVREAFVDDPRATRPLVVRSDARLDNGVTDPVSDTIHAGSATSWHLAAEGDANHGLVVSTLAGRNRQPRVRVSPLTKGQFGIAIDIEHVVGCAAIDWRGLTKSTA